MQEQHVEYIAEALSRFFGQEFVVSAKEKSQVERTDEKEGKNKRKSA
jgi:hypothetical protein